MPQGFDFRLWFRLAKSARNIEKTGTLTASQRAISGMVFNKARPCCLNNDQRKSRNSYQGNSVTLLALSPGLVEANRTSNNSGPALQQPRHYVA